MRTTALLLLGLLLASASCTKIVKKKGLGGDTGDTTSDVTEVSDVLDVLDDSKGDGSGDVSLDADLDVDVPDIDDADGNSELDAEVEDKSCEPEACDPEDYPQFEIGACEKLAWSSATRACARSCLAARVWRVPGFLIAWASSRMTRYHRNACSQGCLVSMA